MLEGDSAERSVVSDEHEKPRIAIGAVRVRTEAGAVAVWILQAGRRKAPRFLLRLQQPYQHREDPLQMFKRAQQRLLISQSTHHTPSRLSVPFTHNILRVCNYVIVPCNRRVGEHSRTVYVEGRASGFRGLREQIAGRKNPESSGQEREQRLRTAALPFRHLQKLIHRQRKPHFHGRQRRPRLHDQLAQNALQGRR